MAKKEDITQKKKPKKTLGQLKKRQRLLQMLLFSFVTIMIWVGFSLFRSQRSTGIEPRLKQLAIPLTPAINEEVLTTLRSKRMYSQSELSGFPIYKFLFLKDEGIERVVTIEVQEEELEQQATLSTPAPTPETIASESAVIDSTPETATPSGETQ